MRVIKRLAIELFYKKWPAAERPMSEWWSRTKKANWHNFAEVKATFGQTDHVKVASGNTVLIFDVGGNKYRIIAAVGYPKQKLYILRVFTHREYDRQPWKEQL